ncbi:MAG: deoxyguanosinetriphosphate triphosphohydrolase [Armatimonadetes bacterium]|nr:MAG: deoxyguanosinetriphosphate triphosphohydrolase [Armatimonadota bacterium]
MHKVSHPIRERIEAAEREWLAPYAAKAAESRGRIREEPQDPVRTVFQRDRDRILHSKSFRRLKHKTQVFISPQGDHYRTRLTHTLEVAQIARTVSRALRLNEDLTEAIALGHDVGHTPFGHAGESALDEAMQEIQPGARFRHYEQSVRVLTVLENDGKGLNLTRETLAGISGHSKGDRDLDEQIEATSPGSLEAAVVRFSDRIAYLNHDLDDGLRAGWLRWDELPKEIRTLGGRHGERIGAMVSDLIESSEGKPVIQLSDSMRQALDLMKDYLFEHLYYDYARKLPDVAKAQHVVRSLFQHYIQNPDTLPSPYRGLEGTVDYISGMTDRYAIRRYQSLFVPSDWAGGASDETG